MVECGELVYIIPNFLVSGVENMGAVFVDLNIADALGIGVSRNMAAAVDDQTALSSQM